MAALSDTGRVTTASTWTSDGAIVLRPASEADLDSDAMRQALRDQVERGYEGTPPEPRTGLESYAIEVAGALVGVLGFRRDVPHTHAMTVDVLAITVPERGHAYGTRALLAAERRLAEDGIVEGYARVPRGNGRGLYFMLRCGYAPCDTLEPEGPDNEGVTWFRRSPILEPHADSAREPAAAAPPRGTRSPQRPRSHPAG